MTNLLIVAHHNLDSSLYNSKLLEQARELANLDVKILDGSILEHFNVNIEKEQQLIQQYNNIILQFPFSWYTMPAVLKNYIDKVFARGFAHGPDGDKLKNKKLLMCITCGGVESSYKEGGYNAYSFNDFLKPINLIFKTAQMNILEPLVIFGCNPTTGDSNLSTEINLFINEYKEAIINL